METKECKTCHAIKPINEFHKHPQYADGHDSTCGACRSEQRKKRRQKQKNEQLMKVAQMIYDGVKGGSYSVENVAEAIMYIR